MMFFVDATIFIKWISASPKALSFEAALSGYALYKISQGIPALTTTLVKDEVLIWLSRYRASKLEQFLNSLKTLASLRIVAPLQRHEEEAVRMYGKYPLGISDLINLSVMKSYNINIVYSTDKGFDSVPWVKRIFKELAQEEEFVEFLSMLKKKGIKFSFNYQK